MWGLDTGEVDRSYYLIRLRMLRPRLGLCVAGAGSGARLRNTYARALAAELEESLKTRSIELDLSESGRRVRVEEEKLGARMRLR